MNFLFDSKDDAPVLVVNELSGAAIFHCFQALWLAHQAGDLPALGVTK